MKRCRSAEPEKNEKLLFRALIFTAFIFGLLFSRETSLKLSLQGSRSELILYLVPPGLALIFSSSILGMLLLPLSSFGYGVICFCMAEKIVLRYLEAGRADLREAGLMMLAVPVFFLVSVNGMETSKILLSTLSACGAGVKNAYNREYIPMALALTAAAAVSLFVIA